MGKDITQPAEQTSGAAIASPPQSAISNGLKRSKPGGSLTVSDSKKIRLETAEEDRHDYDRKIGDRDLQTAVPRYGPYSSMFNNPQQAQIYLNAVQWTPPCDPTDSIPTNPRQMEPYVVQVYNSMIDTQTGFYDKLSAANRILNGKYDPGVVQATAWLIVVSIFSIQTM
jgi:hypothetical protein